MIKSILRMRFFWEIFLKLEAYGESTIFLQSWFNNRNRDMLSLSRNFAIFSAIYICWSPEFALIFFNVEEMLFRNVRSTFNVYLKGKTPYNYILTCQFL